jgi:hypothetical protein
VTPIGNHPILQETGRFETRKGKWRRVKRKPQ